MRVSCTPCFPRIVCHDYPAVLKPFPKNPGFFPEVDLPDLLHEDTSALFPSPAGLCDEFSKHIARSSSACGPVCTPFNPKDPELFPVCPFTSGITVARLSSSQIPCGALLPAFTGFHSSIPCVYCPTSQNPEFFPACQFTSGSTQFFLSLLVILCAPFLVAFGVSQASFHLASILCAYISNPSFFQTAFTSGFTVVFCALLLIPGALFVGALCVSQVSAFCANTLCVYLPTSQKNFPGLNLPETCFSALVMPQLATLPTLVRVIGSIVEIHVARIPFAWLGTPTFQCVVGGVTSVATLLFALVPGWPGALAIATTATACHYTSLWRIHCLGILFPTPLVALVHLTATCQSFTPTNIGVGSGDGLLHLLLHTMHVLLHHPQHRLPLWLLFHPLHRHQWHPPRHVYTTPRSVLPSPSNPAFLMVHVGLVAAPIHLHPHLTNPPRIDLLSCSALTAPAVTVAVAILAALLNLPAPPVLLLQSGLPPPLLLRPARVLSAFALLLLHALGTSGRPGTRSGKRLCLRSRPHLSPLLHHHHHPPHRTHVHTRLSMPLGPYARAHLLQCGRPSIQTLSPLTGILLCAFPVANTKIVTPPTARLSLHLHRTRHRQHLLLPLIPGSTQSSHHSSPPPVPSQPLCTQPGPRTRTTPGLFLHLHLHLPLLTRSPSQGTWHFHQHLLMLPSQLLLHLHLPWLHLLLLLPSCLFCRPLLLPPALPSCMLPLVLMALLLSSETLSGTLVLFFLRSPPGCQVFFVL